MLAHQRSNAEEKSDTELTRINVGDEIHGEAKQTCCSTRMDGTGREGTKATFQEQNARHNDLQGAEADAGSFKTKSSSLRDHNWSQTTSKEFSAALIESAGLACTLTRSCRPTGDVLKFPQTV
jgi:hypothetical protein